jgi:hypothetical protein
VSPVVAAGVRVLEPHDAIAGAQRGYSARDLEGTYGVWDGKAEAVADGRRVAVPGIGVV